MKRALGIRPLAFFLSPTSLCSLQTFSSRSSQFFPILSSLSPLDNMVSSTLELDQPKEAPPEAQVEVEELPTYTVTCREKTYTLTLAQIQTDSPNFFSTAFLGEYTESETRSITVDRRNDTFEIILQYLDGHDLVYDVLQGHFKLEGHETGHAVRLLEAEVAYFGLDRLERLLDVGNIPTWTYPIGDEDIQFEDWLRFDDYLFSHSADAVHSMAYRTRGVFMMFDFHNIEVV